VLVTKEDRSSTVKRRTQIVIASATFAAAIAAAGTGIAVASGGDDSHDVPITGAALDQASAAALAHTGGGRVTATEVGDEESYYQVEITLDGGAQVDVQLDKSFVVVASAADNENAGSQR
jgi:uncharacterized membrane protein YkoI